MQNTIVLMIGDVMGDPGLEVLEKGLPLLIGEYSPDFIMVNGENSAGGFGLNADTLSRILAAGADVVSSGNHVWEKREFWPFMESEERILRPENYPKGNPGRGWIRLQKSIQGKNRIFLAINLQGREFMNPIDCPFRCFDSLWDGAAEQDKLKENAVILVDFHAESSREKEALGFYLDGRASVVAGTHTHVQTADEKILPNGTAYITDLGMTGVSNSVIGMDPKICIDRARYQVLYHMEAAAGGSAESTAAVQGIAAEIDEETGKAVSIKRINLKP